MEEDGNCGSLSAKEDGGRGQAPPAEKDSGGWASQALAERPLGRDDDRTFEADGEASQALVSMAGGEYASVFSAGTAGPDDTRPADPYIGFLDRRKL